MFVFFGISATSFAANYFFNRKNTYRTDLPTQTYEWGPYAKIETCKTALAKEIKDFSDIFDKTYDTWSSCYTGNNIKITDVSPKEGMPGDMLTITGTDFKSITNVTFGKIVVEGPFSIADGNKIYINIPNTATEGKATITVKDYTRGSATTEVTVKTTGQMWYWSNEYHQIMGKGGFRSTEGFATKSECDANRAEALKSRSDRTVFAECFPSTKTVIATAVQNEIDATNGTVTINKELTGNRVFDEDYNLLAPLPGINKVDKTNTLGTYLNFLFKFAISICAGLAVLMIVIYGVQYMGDGSVFGHTEAKSKIGSAIMGLLLALGAYALLNTINPDLVGSGGININQVSITLASSAREQRLSETQKSDVKFYRTSYYDKVKSIIASDSRYKIPHCLMQVAVQRESAGNPNKLFLVGHDEDVAYLGIPSRVDFIKSGKTFKGVTFAYSNALITKSSFLNDDHGKNGIYSAPDLNADDLGLDWRFSHGMGLAGVTFFPKGSTRGANYDKGASMPISGTKFFPKDLKNIDIDLKAAVEIMTVAYNKCGTAEGAYRAYGSGNCKGDNPFTNVEAPLRTNLYNQCVAQDK